MVQQLVVVWRCFFHRSFDGNNYKALEDVLPTNHVTNLAKIWDDGEMQLFFTGMGWWYEKSLPCL